jgi:hypothetical protein
MKQSPLASLCRFQPTYKATGPQGQESKHEQKRNK